MNIKNIRRCFRASPAALSLLTLLALNLSQENVSAAAETVCEPQYDYHAKFGSGEYSALVAHSSRLALHFYTNAHDSTVYYQVGMLTGSGTHWTASQIFKTGAWWPAVSISKEGLVVAVYSDRKDRIGSQQYYRVGWIDPDGGVNQSITWRTGAIHWDGGSSSSVAINDAGFIVSVHESNEPGSTRLHYRVRRFADLLQGDYSIRWHSGQAGIGYDDGINPHIAINDLNQVVEVHEVGTGGLQYRRGIIAGINGTEIRFEQSQPYDDNGADPAIVLLNSGLVLEIHISDGLYSRAGVLVRANMHEIEWRIPVRIRENFDAVNPALATAASFALTIYRDKQDPGNGIYLSTTLSSWSCD